MARPTLYGHTTVEEYLAFEETTPEKHELFRGRICAMAGGSSNHSAIIVSLTGACREALRGRKPCRSVGENQKAVVQKSGSSYRPDGAIACPPNDLDRSRGTYDDPTVVFEVLSPSTAEFDRTEKFNDYRTLTSMQDYVLVESEKVRVEVFSRLEDGRWEQQVYLPETVAHIPSVGIDLSLDELYKNAVFDEPPKDEPTS